MQIQQSVNDTQLLQMRDSSESDLNKKSSENYHLQIYPPQNLQKTSSYQANSRQRSTNLKQSVISEIALQGRMPRTPSKPVQTQQTPIQQISETQSQIYHLIDELDFRLKSNYQNKETSLIESYRQEIIKAHRDLVELKNNTNQQQIKNQMNEKSQQMKKQRLQLIQANMLFSNKCKQYKKLLEQRITQGIQLQREIQFLQKQVNNSQKKRIQLIGQAYQNSSPVKNIQRTQNEELSSQNFLSLESVNLNAQKNKADLISQTPYKNSSLTTHANTQVMKKLNLSSASKQKIKSKLSKMPEVSSQLKKLFQQKLNGSQNSPSDRSNISRKNATVFTKISALNQQKAQNQIKSNQTSHIQNLFIKSVNEVKQKRGHKKDIALFKGEQFTDIEKKEIMKQFLSQEQVKQYIYSIIFEKPNDTHLFRKQSIKDKFKIVAYDNKQTN